MLGAAAGLVVEGIGRSTPGALLGALAGVLFVMVAERVVAHRDVLELGGLHGVDARKAVLIVGVMTVHSVAEGVGVGASFGGGAAFGLSSRSRSPCTTSPRASRSAWCSSPAGPRSARPPPGACSRACPSP